MERQAASEGDNLNRAWFHEVLESLGARVIYDEIGNQYGLFELVPGADYVGLGSHLDSQPLAGRFDGAYGVLAAASIVFFAFIGFDVVATTAEEITACSEGVVSW